MESYLTLLDHVISVGAIVPSRAGPTRSITGISEDFDMQDYRFPCITTRPFNYKAALGELAVFLRGFNSIDAFEKFGCHYWKKNAEAWRPGQGTIGRLYGVQWRRWRAPDGHEVDQIEDLINGIRDDPYSRRHLLTAWNPGELDEMCLPPCHVMAQFFARGNHLSCAVYMRSVDLCLGLPSDLVLYGALLALISQETGRQPCQLTFFMGDAHVYENHVANARLLVQRSPLKPVVYNLDSTATTDNFTPAMLEIQEPELPNNYLNLHFPLNV